MRLFFLGTGAAEGFPSPFCECASCREARALGGRNVRLRSALLVNHDLLIDMGPDLVAAAQRHNLRFSTIRTALITHAHGDHLYVNNIEYRKPSFSVVQPPPMRIFGPADALAMIQARFPDLDEVLVDLQPIGPFESWEYGGYRFASYRAFHAEGKYQCLFYSVDDGQRRFLYAVDTGPFPDSTWQALAGQSFDCIILEETEGYGQWPQHMNIERFLHHLQRFRSQGMLRPGGKVYAQHISHAWNPVHGGLVDILEPRGAIVAYDGMVVDL